MELREYNESHKDHVVKAAVDSLKRLNSTINDMQKWNTDRAALQNDVWRLQAAFHNVQQNASGVLLFRDPLVRQQSDEIRRLQVTNDCMKKKLESLSSVPIKNENALAWDIDKKVKREIARVNSQVAEERIQLMKELAQLKTQLKEAEANPALQQIKSELEKFAKGDRKLDNFLRKVTSKVLHTVKDLSDKLLKVSENIRHSESKKNYLHQSDDSQLRYNTGKSQLQYLISIKRNSAITLMPNNKLWNQVKSLELETDSKLSSLQTNLSDLSEGEVEKRQSIVKMTEYSPRKLWPSKSAKEFRMINLTNQTIKEATKNKTSNESECQRLIAESEDSKEECVRLRKELIKLRIENRGFKDAKIIHKKQHAIIGEKSVKEREALQNKVRILTMRIAKLMGEIKADQIKNNQYEKDIGELENEKTILKSKVNGMSKNLEEMAQEQEQLKMKKKDLEVIVKIVTQEKDIIMNNYNDKKNELSLINEELEKYKSENFHINELLCKSNDTNDELINESKKYTLETEALTAHVIKLQKEIQDQSVCIETMSTTISSLQVLNAEMKSSVDTSKAEMERLKTDLIIINNENGMLKCRLKKFLSEKRSLKSDAKHQSKEHDPSSTSCNKVLSRDDLDMENIREFKKKVKNKLESKTIDKMVSNSEKVLLKSLEETDKELMEMKNELIKVKQDIGFLRNNVDTSKFGLKNRETENYALKQELGKLRKEKHQLEAALQKIKREI